VRLFCVRKRRSASGPTARDHLLFSSQREPGDEVTLEDGTLRRRPTGQVVDVHVSQDHNMFQPYTLTQLIPEARLLAVLEQSHI
jgi:hypothetical protein